jgi:hypothetical protein
MQDLLHRLARELRIAAAIADECQGATGDAQAPELDHETTMRLQGLDLLSQHLVEVGLVLDRLATSGIGGDAPSSVLSDVCLSDLKQRLAGLKTDGVRILDPELW